MIWIDEDPRFITDIKGKKYMQVNGRLHSFWRWVKDNGYSATIDTILTTPDEQTVRVAATVTVLNPIEYGSDIRTTEVNADQWNVLLFQVTGHAEEKRTGHINSTSAVENAETSAIGRALGILGFGIDAGVASADEVEGAISKQKQTAKGAEINKKIAANPDLSALLHEKVKAKAISIEDAQGLAESMGYNVAKVSEYFQATEQMEKDK